MPDSLSISTFAQVYPSEMNLVKQIGKYWIILHGLWDQLNHSKFGAALRNKYILTSLIFLVWLLLFDQNNLTERRKSAREYNQLLQERGYYQHKIEEDKKRINELKTDDDNLEKFAREQYLMKKDNEDIFVIVDE